jgi:head-tail adaptor
MKCPCPTLPRLTHRVTIERPKTTPDAGGHVDLAQDSNWQSVRTIWFRFVSHTGRESRVFDQVQAETNHVLEINDDTFTKTIIPKWRGKYGTRKLNINAIYEKDDSRRRLLMEVTEAR